MENQNISNFTSNLSSQKEEDKQIYDNNQNKTLIGVKRERENIDILTNEESKKAKLENSNYISFENLPVINQNFQPTSNVINNTYQNLSTYNIYNNLAKQNIVNPIPPPVYAYNNPGQIYYYNQQNLPIQRKILFFNLENIYSNTRYPVNQYNQNIYPNNYGYNQNGLVNQSIYPPPTPASYITNYSQSILNQNQQ